MSELFNLEQFNKYREDNRREVKRAKNGLPHSLWETYSSFANTDGGVIILGVDERKDGTWTTTGLKPEDESKLLKDFWDTVNNHTKVSENILTEKDVAVYEYNDDAVIVIFVPRANRESKPIFINDNIFSGSYRRNHEGDYHCTREQIKAMLRDQTEETADMMVVDVVKLSDLNRETIRGYRNSHRALKPGHPFERLSDDEFLRSIEAAAVSDKDGELHPTAAGLLMFGNDYDIVRHYPEYFLDYREVVDTSTRWVDRIESTSGDWSGNLFDFYFRVYNKLARDIKVPFKLEGITRADDTPVHKAIREALANCLINADYYGRCGVVILKEQNRISLRNPGYIRTGKKQMRLGGKSDPRNKALMKMFNLLEIGERAGSGVPNIFNVWADEGWPEPVITEEFDPDMTTLSLVLLKKQAAKPSDGKQATKRKSSKTVKHKETIIEYLSHAKEADTKELAEVLSLSPQRTRAILADMPEVESQGTNNNNRTYRLKSD